MIQRLSGKYRKTTALTLFLPIYLQLGLPAVARAFGDKENSFIPLTLKGFHKRGAGSSFQAISNGMDNQDLLFTGVEMPGTSKQNNVGFLMNNADKKADDIGGPGQPEMSSFQSVNGGNLVDLFSGDFSYSIPLMDVGGYPVNIHYNSGVTMDQEASWVGLGWNVNPGTVTRNMRGLPDDFNGTDSITKTQNIKVNKTVGVKLGPDAEMAGLPLNITYQLGVFHNNYNGWGVEEGINASINLASKTKGSLTSGDSTVSSILAKLKIGLSNNSQTGLTTSASLNVALDKFNSKETIKSSNYGISTNYHSRAGITSLTIEAQNSKFDKLIKNAFNTTTDGPTKVPISFAQPSVTPTISMPTTSANYGFHAKVGGEAFLLHGNLFIEGYVNKQYIRPEDTTQKLPAYGYLYFTDANNNPLALMDFNREKELQFNYRSTPNIAIPQYTYDVYAISGEGTGGTIRPYRGDIGYIRDHFMRTRSSDNNFSAEFGTGNLFHGGLSYDLVKAFTENDEWSQNNQLKSHIQFRSDDTTFQSVYFRNPGEKTSNSVEYYDQVGGDELVRVKLNDAQKSAVSADTKLLLYRTNTDADGEITVPTNAGKKERDKRSQVITYLNAKDAADHGLDKEIYSYKENTVPEGACMDTIETIQRVDGSIRKENHISEIDVLNPDGRRYVYGIPAYNIEQEDVTFSVNKETSSSNIDSGLVSYTKDLDNTTHNNKGKENYFSKEKMPAYAHSYLLTGILSPDYVDITGNGITEDDQGDAIKFNYTRVYGPAQGYYDWRTPGSKDKANYNEGFKTYNRDDKGTYLYGKKEVWYTHSIESKTMIALFKISDDREDAFAVIDQNGGINKDKPLRKLDSIELYAKSDLLENGSSAKPIKTVHFEYTYDLCKGYAGDTSKGKLTLKKIWFSYNKNYKGKLNPYVFTYHSFNPNYHPKKYDRWGNYKDEDENPGDLSNADFPYVTKDSSVAAQDVGAWNLAEIKLPSGGRMKVTYESDDYAYVQNKRAMQMFTIEGFGESPADNPDNNLYRKQSTANFKSREYLFVQSPSGVTISSKDDIFRKYLEGNEWIYMKLAVTMPGDRWGSGYEFIPVYARVKDYGLTSVANRFWIKFEELDNETPMVRYAMQFLRLNLPSKAYPSSELGDDIDLGDAVKMLGSSFSEIVNSVAGFVDASKGRGWCKSVETSKSFIRLNSPLYCKYGGGLRVKRVEIYDNWNAMTSQRESVYGQEYIYKTSIEVNGQKQLISSGVATYEPMIGNEENPFRVPVNYEDKIAPLAPVSFLYSEMPLGESYFPGASVGYSKVRVRTINAKAKSANGWEETEFFTSKDFPTIVNNTLLDAGAKKRYKPKLLSLLKIYSVDRMTVSQGFKIELNDMNGKVKAQASYAENDSLNPISYVLNFYKVDDDRAAVKKLNNTVWVVDSLSGSINKEGVIGKDIELMVDFRQQKSQSLSGGISPNVDGFVWPFPPIVIPVPTLFKLPQFDETQFRSAATVKIVQRYGILDSVVVMDKGSVVSTKNLVYDGETGEVVLSRTSNEFNDPIFNFSYPAHWAYSGMGMAYKNIGAIFTDLFLFNGKLHYGKDPDPFPAERFFESGDEILVTGTAKTVNTGDQCYDFNPAIPDKPMTRKLWAIAAEKGKENDRGIYFIDSAGVPVSGHVSTMQIIRSGKRNMLDASVGSIVSLENPVREVTTGKFKIVIDSNTKVVNTSAVTYKDFWQVENSLYQKDSCYTVTTTVTDQLFYPSNKSALFRIIHTRSGKTTHYITTLYENNIYSKEFIASSRQLNSNNVYDDHNHGKYSHNFDIKSVLKFDLQGIPSSATITNASLYLYASAPTTAWNNLPSNLPNNVGSIIQSEFSPKTRAHFKTGALNTRTNESVIRQALSWNINTTKYSTLYGLSQNSVQLAQTPDDTCIDRTLNVTGIVSSMVQNPAQNFGFLMQLKDLDVGKESNSSERTQTYCSDNDDLLKYIPPSGCTNCYPPLLYVSYTYQKDTCVKLCRYNISDTAVNPYRWGILGNWRMDRAYTYYYDRKESDASVTTTDIRKEGVLKDFQPYWNFTDSVLENTTDTSRWVWNSAMSLYNKKGFEIENYDPLGRYNAGLYGYNQTLPVAVAQNAKYREILYDGFEDYEYHTTATTCITCPPPKEIDFYTGQTGVTLSQQQAHSGKYSIKVTSGNTSSVTFPVITLASDTLKPNLSAQVDSTPVYIEKVVGAGTGLSGTYQGYSQSGSVCTTTPVTVTQTDTTINFNWMTNAPVSGICPAPSLLPSYEVTWKGKIQPRYSDYYRFSGFVAGGAATIKVIGPSSSVIVTGTSSYLSNAIYLQAGHLYDIIISYAKFKRGNASISLNWRSSLRQQVEIIPKKFLYPEDMVAADTVGSITRDILYYCVNLNKVKTENIINPKFSPYREVKMVVGAWVRIDGDDYNTAATLDGPVTLTFDYGLNEVALQKRGVRIEGWQRYESVIEMPWNATVITVNLKGVSGRNVFFDDLRIQPFNSNMKSYVYDPVSLRLMAELDENNYASYYEYDDDGTLIRVKKETEKGVMTITETRSALIKEE